MQKFGDLLLATRKKKKISLDRVAKDLVIIKDHLEALENEKWEQLPEPAFIKGYIKSYCDYLGLDANYALALFRREFDESKYPKKPVARREKRFFITPNKVINFIFALSILAFLAYIIIQYLSVLSSPKLEIINPKDNQTTSAPAVKIEGETEKDATVSINGEFIPVSETGNFSYEYVLSEGKNVVEVVASFRLSPKNKVVREIRLIR